jgi:protein-disulfide isomerase
MQNFIVKNKTSLIIVFITLLIFIGGVFLFSRGSVTDSGQSSLTVNSDLLVPQGSYETSGFSDGTYLPSSASAVVTIVEFGDYECPACGTYNPFIKQLLTNFAGKINYVFRNYAISYHANALSSSYAAEAAGLQGKYWEMHDILYSNQSEWSNLEDPMSVFVGYAKDLGLDIDKFTNDMNSSNIKDKVQNDINDGNAVGITATPTFFVNGKKISLTGSYDQLKSIVESELNAK